MDKKNRSRNFTKREKSVLLDIANNFVHIIENKKTDATTNKIKLDAWSKIARSYNSQQISGIRSVDQLKALYDFLKRKAKKEKNVAKIQMYQTNGVGFSKLTNEDREKIVSTPPPQSAPLPNRFDRDVNNYHDAPQNAVFLAEVKEEPESENSVNSGDLQVDLAPGSSNSSNAETQRDRETVIPLDSLATSSAELSTTKKRNIADRYHRFENFTNKRLKKVDTEEDFTLKINKIKLQCAEIELELKREELSSMKDKAAAENTEVKLRQETLRLENEAARINLEIRKLQLKYLKHNE